GDYFIAPYASLTVKKSQASDGKDGGRTDDGSKDQGRDDSNKPDQGNDGSKPSAAVKRISTPKAESGMHSVTISWKKVSGSGYQIKYSASKKFAKSKTRTVTVRGSGNVKKTLKGLRAGKKYYFKVRAYRKTSSGNVYGKWSKVRAVRTKYAPRVTMKKIKAGKGKFTASWAKAKCSGYQMKVSKNRKFTGGVKSYSLNTNRKTVSKLKKGSVRYVKVRAYKVVNGRKQYGSWSKVKSVKVK
ncbi:MAG: fibronectin type III domain-containing protein, partial [Anaerovoracaceae bacterium]